MRSLPTTGHVKIVGDERWKRPDGISYGHAVEHTREKFGTLLDLCVSSLRRGHANLLCIVPILTDDPREESTERKK